MSPLSRWERIDDCLGEALDLASPEAREALLIERLHDDPEAQSEVRRLLSQAEKAYDLFDRSPVASLASLKAGSRLGPWELVQPLGAGGMGVVWMARRIDGQAEMWAAIKLLPPAFRQPDLEQRFQTEKQILARLEHPGIARLLDAGAGGGETPNFVMEYVEGKALNDYLSLHNPPLSARLQLFLEVCDAVQYAHANLVIHRDLKPQNILVDGNGEPKLLDFGIGKILDQAQGSNATLHRAFSVDYASPEQIRGSAIGTAADIYALGLILYEIVTGSPARRFGSLPLGEVLEKSETFVLPDIGDRDLLAICRKATALEPELRYRTVSELAADVERRRKGHPVLARPAGPLYRMYRFCRRNWVAVTSAAAVLFVISGLSAWGWISAKQAARERAAAMEKSAELQAALLRETEALRKEVEARSAAEAQRLEAQKQSELARRMQSVAGQRERQAEERMRSLLLLYQASMGSAVQSVAKLSGGTKTSIAWLEAALQRLSELKPSEAGRPAYLAMQAETYMNLATLYGGPNSNLGQKEKYRANVARAAELWAEVQREAPRRPEWIRGYLNARFALLRMNSKQLSANVPLPPEWQQMERDFLQLAEKAPQTGRSVAEYYFWRASFSVMTVDKVNDWRKALAWFERTLDLSNPTPTALRDCALIHKYLAASSTVELQERLEHADSAVRLDKLRTEITPDDAASKLDLAFSISTSADVIKLVGDSRTAQKKYAESFLLRKSLAANDRDNSFLTTSLWYPLRWSARGALALEDWDALRTAYEGFQWVTKEFPKKKPTPSDEAGFAYVEGLLAEQAGDQTHACSAFARALQAQRSDPTPEQSGWHASDQLIQKHTSRCLSPSTATAPQ